MMNDRSYVRDFSEKRALYEAEGITQWRNMIYLYATDNNLDMREIDAVIRTKVMAWL